MTRPTRRRLFQFAAAGGLAAALGGVGVAVQGTVLRTPKAPLKILSVQAFSILSALADRICPAGRGFPAASELGVPENIDALMSTVHPGDAADLEVALLFLENALPGLLLDGRGRPFTACDGDAQDRAIEAFRTSAVGPRRQVFKATYGLIAGAYWAMSSVHGRIGYLGAPDYGNRRVGEGVSRPPIERRPIEPPGPLAPREDVAAVDEGEDTAEEQTP